MLHLMHPPTLHLIPHLTGIQIETITHPRPLHRSRAGVLQDPTQSLQVTNVTGMGTDARASSGDPGSVSVDVPRSRGPTCRRGHNTFSRYYQSLMYAELRTFETIRKKPCRIGPGLCGTSENSSTKNFESIRNLVCAATTPLLF